MHKNFTLPGGLLILIVHMFRANPLRLWAKDILPPIDTPPLQETGDSSWEDARKFGDTPPQRYQVLEILRDKLQLQRNAPQVLTTLS